MKKLLLVYLALLVASVALAQRFPPGPLVSSKKAEAGGGLASFSDDFNRADSDSLGSNWTEADPDCDISSNQFLVPQTFDTTDNIAIYTATSCTTVEQYAKSTITFGSQRRNLWILRYTDASSPFYLVYHDVDNQLIRWYHYTSIGGTATQIGATAVSSFTPSSPSAIGLTISGTGTSTILRVWQSVTANAPTSASSWDGGAATVTMTDDPASPVNTGSKIGLGGVATGGTVIHDDFYGGDIP